MLKVVQSVPGVSRREVAPFDFIVVTTKNIPDEHPAIADIIAPAVTPGMTAIVLTQNGLNIEKPLVCQFPTNPIISSVVFTGASRTLHGKVHHTDPDIQRIGPFYSPQVSIHMAENATRRYIAVYNPCGELDITFDSNVAGSRWRKLAYNASFNPVAAILRMDTSRMRMSEHTVDDMIIPIIYEIRAAAEASGITLQDDLIDAVLCQDPLYSEFKPSMCQDIEEGNLMEIENIVGEPLREGEMRGVSMPTLRIVYYLLKVLQLQVKKSRGLWKPDFNQAIP